MRVSINWIKKFVDIDGIAVKEIGEKLTMSGLEVEGIETRTAPKGVVVGKVLKREKHPNADKLSLCVVTDGESEFQVVCGAPNVDAGQVVPFAKLGAELPGGLKIKAAKIRGIESQGMICSAAELGLEEESEGILILEPTAKLGEDINRLLEIEDSMLEINVTPNRADCLSIVGVAREISVLFDRPIKKYPFECIESDEPASSYRYVRVDNKINCPLYYGRIIRGVKLGESPLWLANRIRSAGIRPINNIVDITNFVMIEYGQPLHAFDLRMIEGGIIVRDAKEGEKIVTLDGKERTLSREMLVIADEKKVLAIAGIMGGEYSGIQDDTVDVFLECAYFRPESIRMTSRRLGLKTDSSYRYERGIDRLNTMKIVDYAAELISEIAGGKVLKGVLKDGIEEYRHSVVEFDTHKINSMLGIELEDEKISGILEKLGFEVNCKDKGKGIYTATVPSFRQDVAVWQDLSEEVARIYGYEKIPVTVPKINAISRKIEPVQKGIRDVKNILVSLGYNEVINYSFMEKGFLGKFLNSEEFIPVKNPISADMDTMRSMVFPGVLKSLMSNYCMGLRQIKLFEISNVHKKNNDGILPMEETNVSFGVLGDYFKPNWIGKMEADNFYYIKSAAEQILAMFRLAGEYVRSNERFLHKGKSADIVLGGIKAGFIGELHPELYDFLDLQSPVYICEIQLNKLVELGEKNVIKYKKISQFPFVYKDISVIAGKDISAVDIFKGIKGYSELIKDVELFDIYVGEKIGMDKRSMTFRVYFNHPEKTLTDEETNTAVENIIKLLQEKYGVTLR